MKKTILSLALVASALFASAQSAFVIYDGTGAQYLGGDPYTFDNATVKDSIVLGETMLYMEGEDKAGAGGAGGYYIGGVGGSSYDANGDAQTFTQFGLSLSVATSTFGFNAYTVGTSSKVKIQLKSTAGTWGYEFDLATASAAPTDFSVPMGDFKALVGDNPTGDPITDTDLGGINEVQFILVCTDNTGDCVGKYFLDNIKITSNATGLEDNFLSANANQVVSVYDMMGKFVATGKLKELGLESGKLYVVKSGNKSRKIVMN